MPQQVIDPGIEGHDAVEHAHLIVGVELYEYLGLAHRASSWWVPWPRLPWPCLRRIRDFRMLTTSVGVAPNGQNTIDL